MIIIYSIVYLVLICLFSSWSNWRTGSVLASIQVLILTGISSMIQVDRTFWGWLGPSMNASAECITSMGFINVLIISFSLFITSNINRKQASRSSSAQKPQVSKSGMILLMTLLIICTSILVLVSIQVGYLQSDTFVKVFIGQQESSLENISYTTLSKLFMSLFAFALTLTLHFRKKISVYTVSGSLLTAITAFGYIAYSKKSSFIYILIILFFALKSPEVRVRFKFSFRNLLRTLITFSLLVFIFMYSLTVFADNIGHRGRIEPGFLAGSAGRILASQTAGSAFRSCEAYNLLDFKQEYIPLITRYINRNADDRAIYQGKTLSPREGTYVGVGAYSQYAYSFGFIGGALALLAVYCCSFWFDNLLRHEIHRSGSRPSTLILRSQYSVWVITLLDFTLRRPFDIRFPIILPITVVTPLIYLCLLDIIQSRRPK